MPGISIILPVYQGEIYLKNCVESVRRQTFSDWELLIVDDGSTDDTAAIAEECAAADDRIRFFRRKKNGGVSEARNLGVNEARGDFLTFLNVDDRYEHTALEVMWSLQEATKADTVGFAYLALGADGSKTEVPLLKEGVYEAGDIGEKLVTPLLAYRLRLPVLGGQVWRWMFSARLIREGRLSFHGKYLEDELFTLEYLCLARRLAVTEQALYRSFRNPASVPGYRKDLERQFDRYLERKSAIAKKHSLDAPLWREENLWAGLLTLVENEYHKGNSAKAKEKQKAVEALCKREDFAAAIAALAPEGLHPNRQMTANYIRGRHFFLLTQMYRLKFGI